MINIFEIRFQINKNNSRSFAFMSLRSFVHSNLLSLVLLQSFKPLSDSFTLNSFLSGSCRRSRSKLLHSSASRTDLKRNISNGSKKSMSSSGRFRKEIGSNLSQQIGLLSLYSASFAHPALSLNESVSVKGNRFNSGKVPLIVVVGNKEDLCGSSSHSFYKSGQVQAVDKSCFVDAARPLYAQRKTSLVNAEQSVRKNLKCQYYKCSVKLDWNVTAIVTDILRSIFAPETQKNGRFKRPALDLNNFLICK